MLLVYTHKITPRVTYAFKHVFTRILGVQVQFTTKVEEFIAHNSIKLSYARKPLSSEVFIKSNELLFDQGLSDVDINVLDWEETKCFFTTNDRSALPFDIFAATFYLLSRYEEYLPHVKDDFGRFLASESLAHKNNFLHQPVIDIWAYKFKAVLEQDFPDFKFPKQEYKVQPVVDVPMAFSYNHKGVLRTLGGLFEDVVRLRFNNVYERLMVLAGFKKDPIDTFNWIINKQKQSPFRFVVFFLIGAYSSFDKNVSINRRSFVSLIKSVSDYSHIGLKASYFAVDQIETLKTESRKLESITNFNLYAVRNSYSKVNLPKTYRNLIELEINKDFTMGYYNTLGFRAGTCTPFQFYDLDYEIQTPLQVNPFMCFDFALLKIGSKLDRKQELQRLIKRVKDVNGTFTAVFHNYSFGSEKRWDGFKELFTIILNSADEK